MSSLSQYTELFEHNSRLIDGHSAPALNALRPEALAALRRFGRLPGRHDEGYEKLSPEELFAPDYGVNINRVPFSVDVARTFRCDVPNISTLLGIVVNDEFRPTATLTKNCPEGLTVMSLAEAARVRPEIVTAYLGRLSANRDAATALNTLLAQDGVFIHVAAGVRIDKAVQIVNIFNAGADMMSVRRMLVVLEAGASARLLVCDHCQNREHDYLSSCVTEVYLGEGSHLDLCDIEESSERCSRMSQLYVSQYASSSLNVNTTSLTVGRTRNEFHVAICGEHCSTDLSGMAIADAGQIVDNASFIRHNSPRCHSNQLFKYLLDGKAQGAFEGLIYVAPDAVATEAYQSNRNILASDDARMHTAPQLEIYCDDVRCSHGAATGQLDSQALFYMRSRGVPLPEARMMLMQAFMADVIDHVSIDGLRDRLRHLVERRLTGDRSACGDCAATCHN